MELAEQAAQRGYFLLKKVNRAIREHRMIQDGDTVAVAVSGGKDSLSLLTLLHLRRQRIQQDYRLVAIHVQGDARGPQCPSHLPLHRWLEDSGYPFTIVPIDLPPGEPLPLTCQRCAWNRRKTIFQAADRLGCNVVALAHQHHSHRSGFLWLRLTPCVTLPTWLEYSILCPEPVARGKGMKNFRPTGRNKYFTRQWLLVTLALMGLVTLLGLLVLVPAVVRALPGRYAVRLPGFLQELRHRPHADTLPTPDMGVAPAALLASTPTALHLSGVTVASATPQATATHLVVSASSAMQSTSLPENTSTIVPSPTSEPTFTPRPSTPTPSSTPTPDLLPLQASLPPITHTHQTWNNCGPATISMALGYFGRQETQAEAATFLKPDPEDKNVSPSELADYVRSLDLAVTLRFGGDLTRLKRLLAAGFPVIVETWFIPEPGDQMGHYRLLTGYDDEGSYFIAHDSYNGPNIHLDYAAFDELWRVFNRVYLVPYEPRRAQQLAAILGTDQHDQAMYEQALETARAETQNADPACVAYEDCADGAAFAWFNVGTNLNALGRHQEAAAAYDQARLLGLPWRMLWYQFGPYESYYAAGRYEDVITLTTATLNIVANLEESHYWRGMAYLAQEQVDRARADFNAALKYNPNYTPAAQALESLP